MNLSAGPSGAGPWRGWSENPSVTSRRLRGRAGVANRLFPKTRSWFALGAPLELLTPLSVLRVVLAAATVAWPLLALAARPDARTRWALLAVSIVFAGSWLRTMTIRQIGRRMSVGCVALTTAGVATVVLVGDQTVIACEYLLLVALTSVFVGLFCTSRQLLGHVTSVSVLVAGALTPRLGPAEAVTVAFVAGLGVLSVCVAVAVTTRAARAAGGTDPETGLPNNAGLQRTFGARTDEGPFVVAVVCLAGLAEVREALGHDAGCELLRRAIEDLGQVVPGGATLGRVEGDDLVVIHPVSPTGAGDVSVDAGLEAAEDLARIVLQAVAAGRYLLDGVELSLTARVGLAVAPWDGTEMAELVRRSTLAARKALASGEAYRNWDGSRDALTQDDLALLSDLRLAAGRGELHLEYQPQIDAASGAPTSVEALLRWDHPTRGAVSPGRFIPLAERTGLIDVLTHWSLDEALDAQVRWREAGAPAVPVAVNLSAKVLCQPQLAESVLAALGRRDLPPSTLTLEITETAAAATDLVGIVALLEPLRAQGVRISIDDFGTGYTSLSVLPDLPLDEIKVDLGFVIRSASSPRDDAIVRSVADLAGRLGLAVVAEGVEDLACAERMTRYGFDLLQGFHFARPMPEAALLRYLARTPATAAPA